MNRKHVRLLLAAILLLPLGVTLSAQPFLLSTTPEQASVGGGTAEFRTTVATELGFGASIYFSAEVPSLPLSTVTVAPNILNAPYYDTVVVTITLTGPKTGGTHPVIITAKNGAAVARDTVQLTIPDRTAWTVFTRSDLGLTDATLYWPWKKGFVVDRENGTGWLVADGGILKSYDGTSWQSHGWPDTTYLQPYYRDPSYMWSSTVYDMAIDSSGDLWFGLGTTGVDTANSSYFYCALLTRHTDSTWTINASLDSAHGLTRSVQQQLFRSTSDRDVMHFTPDGTLWIAGGGLVKYDGTDWTTYTLENSGLSNWTRKIITDVYGNVWINMGTMGLAKFDGEYWTSWSNTEIAAGGVYRDLIPKAALADGSVWFRDYHSMMRIDGETNEVSMFHPTPIPEDLSPNDPLLSNRTFESLLGHDVTAADIGPDGHVWIGMKTDRYGNDVFSGGVARFDGSDWYHYTIDNSGLPDNDVVTLAVDDNNQVWVVTSDGSVTILDGTIQASEVFIGGITSVNGSTGSDRSLSIAVSPNPVAGQGNVTLRLSAGVRSGEVTIYNAQGLEVRRFSRRPLLAEAIDLDLAGLPAGPYFVRVEGDSGVHASAALLITP